MRAHEQLDGQNHEEGVRARSVVRAHMCVQERARRASVGACEECVNACERECVRARACARVRVRARRFVEYGRLRRARTCRGLA
eukprot:6194948-Pleurochrysis_carterae.AAC.1